MFNNYIYGFPNHTHHIYQIYIIPEHCLQAYSNWQDNFLYNVQLTITSHHLYIYIITICKAWR